MYIQQHIKIIKQYTIKYIVYAIKIYKSKTIISFQKIYIVL